MEDNSMSTASVRVSVGDLSSHPECSHGPTLLFSRLLKGGRERRFYACSANRDRKDCNFFMLADDKKLKGEIRPRTHINSRRFLENNSVRIAKMLNTPADRRGYCYSCKSLFITHEKEKHTGHDVLEGVNDHLIHHPSELLRQLKCSKKEAQYMFSANSAWVISGILQGLGVTSLICIGAPRIHERVLKEYYPKVKSLLLDIDKRFHNFFNSEQFLHYNMFNNHCFDGEEARKRLKDVVQDENQNVAIVIDPPFGGRVEPLAYTLKTLQKLRRVKVSSSVEPMPVLWVFPYFMEPYILGSCPDYTMLDYKVEYENHPQFREGCGKRGSPVRIFTNVPPNRIPLPEAEGYHYCSICQRWAAPENRHCRFCNACTSKDGRTYVHCKVCKRCVKPTWVHCATCRRCCLSKHNCGQELPCPVACFCGSTTHLSKDCPDRKNNEVERMALKRKMNKAKRSRKRKKVP